MAGFQHDIAGGNGDLIIPALQSPDFSIAGQTGWAIMKNGDAYFFNIVAEGSISSNTVVVSGSGEGIFLYSGVPAAGNLIGAWAQANGTDPYGNAVFTGITVGAQSYGPQVAIVPAAAPGDASGIAFPMPSPALSNTPSIVAGDEPVLVFSGPAVATTGEEDWVQIIMWGNVSGTPSRMEFRRISTSGAVTVSASYNNSGWIFNDPVTLAGGSAMPVTNGSLVTQGSILGDEFTTTIPGGGAFTASAATWLNNFQSKFNDHVSDTQSIIDRVNALVDVVTGAGVGHS